MSDYIIPSLIISLIAYSTYKRNNTYSSFVNGAKQSFDLVLTSFPYIVAIFIAIEVLNSSGLNTIIENVLAPLLSLIGIPKELCNLCIIKPFSGCGSLAVLETIFDIYGVDSYLARAGCAIAGSSEAIFYVIAVYFSKSKVNKYSYLIPVCLIANIVGAMVGALICRAI